MHYRGKVAVVTGASSGIGWVTALELSRRGCTVVGVARREERLRRLETECRAHAPASSYLAGDLGDRAFAERVVADTTAAHGRLDILINNAAISKHKHLYHTSVDEADHVMRVNFMSCVWTTFAAIPVLLRQGGGTIVNVSSFAGKVSPPRESLYAASKAAMNSFTEGLWLDLAGSGIHVGLVIPGAIDTEIWEKEDEPPAYTGVKHPPEIVTRAIMDVIEKKLHEVTAPKRDPQLLAARTLRLLAPSVLRAGMGRFEPVSRDILEAARARARAGKRLGDK
jgi:short-subunit dehydrogenase